MNDCCLIKVTDQLIVSPCQIIKAERNGNYTWVKIKDHGELSEEVWDEDAKLWDAIKDCSA